MKYLRFLDPQTQQSHYGWCSDSTPDQITLLSQAPWAPGSQVLTPTWPLDQVQLQHPCEPSKIVCVGKNYQDHIAEMKGVTGDGSIPREPLLFFKPPSALAPPDSTIVYPLQSQQVDYEGELAVVMGRQAKQLAPHSVPDFIFGYTIANDVTARDLQKQDSQWVRAKGFDTFCPLGPWIVPTLSDRALLETQLNGQTVQSAPLNQMIFGINTLIAYISQILTLLPGDVILTGTPRGVGPVQPGDTISISIEGIGTLTNGVVSSDLPLDSYYQPVDCQNLE